MMSFRSHFGSSHFLFECSNVFFCVTSFSGFVLSKCLQPSFVVSHLLPWLTHARLMMQSTQMCLIRHNKTFLQTSVLRMVLFPTSKEWELAPQVLWPSFTDEGIVSIHRIRSVATITNKISSVEQVVGVLMLASPHWRLVQSQLSSVSGSARSWPSSGQVDGTTVP